MRKLATPREITATTALSGVSRLAPERRREFGPEALRRGFFGMAAESAGRGEQEGCGQVVQLFDLSNSSHCYYSCNQKSKVKDYLLYYW
jgi:hypothetical protein